MDTKHGTPLDWLLLGFVLLALYALATCGQRGEWLQTPTPTLTPPTTAQGSPTSTPEPVITAEPTPISLPTPVLDTRDPIEIVFPAHERPMARCIREYEAHDWYLRSDQEGDAFFPPGSRGWFQIHGYYHGFRFDKYGGWDAAFDPLVNTKVAWEIVEEYGWTLWSTYALCSTMMAYTYA